MEILYLYVAFSYLFMFGVLFKNWPDKANRKVWFGWFVIAPIALPIRIGVWQG